MGLNCTAGYPKAATKETITLRGAGSPTCDCWPAYLSVTRVIAVFSLKGRGHVRSVLTASVAAVDLHPVQEAPVLAAQPRPALFEFIICLLGVPVLTACHSQGTTWPAEGSEVTLSQRRKGGF